MVLPKDPLDVEAVAEGAFAAVEGVLLDAVQQLELKGQKIQSNVEPKVKQALKAWARYLVHIKKGSGMSRLEAWKSTKLKI